MNPFGSTSESSFSPSQGGYTTMEIGYSFDQEHTSQNGTSKKLKSFVLALVVVCVLLFVLFSISDSNAVGTGVSAVSVGMMRVGDDDTGARKRNAAALVSAAHRHQRYAQRLHSMHAAAHASSRDSHGVDWLHQPSPASAGAGAGLGAGAGASEDRRGVAAVGAYSHVADSDAAPMQQALHPSKHGAATSHEASVRRAREKIEKVRQQKSALEGKMAALQRDLDLSIRRQKKAAERQQKAVEASAKARVSRMQDQLARAMRAAAEAKQKAGDARSELVKDKVELSEDKVELSRDQDELSRDRAELKSDGATLNGAEQESGRAAGDPGGAHMHTADTDADADVGDSMANVIMPPPLPPPPSLPARDPGELAYAGPDGDSGADAEGGAYADGEPQPGMGSPGSPHKLASLQSQLELQREVREMARESSQKAKAELCKQQQSPDCE